MKTKITLICLLAFLSFIPKISAQCTNGGWKPPYIISPDPSLVLQTINNDSSGVDFAEIWAYTNLVYTFSTSIATDFITITNENGNVVYAYGYAGLTWQPASNQVIRYYIHSNSTCEDEPIFTVRTRYLATDYSDFNPACAGPTASTVNTITANSAILNWTAPAVIPESGYDIYVSSSNTTPTIDTVPSYQLDNATTTQFVNGLNSGTTYYYWLRSKCNIGIGNWVYRGNFTTTGSVSVGCNSATNGLFPNYTITPTCGVGYETITDQSWASQYSNVNVIANRQYWFSSSVTTDYITITNANGTVVYANGTQPVIWNSGNTTGVIRYFIHTNANCGSSDVNRTRYIRCYDASNCVPPSNLIVSNVTSNSCKITWTAALSLPSSGYDLYIVTTNTAPVVNSTPTLVSTTPSVFLSVGAGITYYYWIRSNCGPTIGVWVSGGNFTTPPALNCNGAINGLYPDATYTPSCSGSFEQIVADAWAGEYANVNVLANKQYTFKSANTTDFITITNATGTTVLASGLTPLIWTSGTNSGVIRYHLNTNANCGTQNTSRVRSIKCTNALGIDKYNADNLLKLYPNPNTGQFTVDTEDIIADNILIIDNLGRIISNHKPNASKTMLNIDSFTDGIYYVKINYQDKNVTKKLILKKN